MKKNNVCISLHSEDMDPKKSKKKKKNRIKIFVIKFYHFIIVSKNNPFYIIVILLPLLLYYSMLYLQLYFPYFLTYEKKEINNDVKKNIIVKS